jgi:hypothetical protein
MNWKEIIREDYKFFIIFIMLGLIMLWTSYVVGPIIHILERQIVIAKYAANTHDDIQANMTELKTKIDKLNHKLGILLNMTRYNYVAR